MARRDVTARSAVEESGFRWPDGTYHWVPPPDLSPADAPVAVFDDVFSDSLFDTSEFASDVAAEVADVEFGDFGIPDIPQLSPLNMDAAPQLIQAGLRQILAPAPASRALVPVRSSAPRLMTDTGIPVDDDFGGNGGGGYVQTGGAGAALITLGAVLARSYGRGIASALFRAANGVSVRMAQLWPLVRQYGPMAVATGLGISADQLLRLLNEAPKTSHKRRRRGISARDLSVTRRTNRQLAKYCRMVGLGSRPRRGRYTRPRRSRGYYC